MRRLRHRLLDVLCLPTWCPYAYACPSHRGRERRVARWECLRFRPPEERPEAALSVGALALLFRLRQEAVR